MVALFSILFPTPKNIEIKHDDSVGTVGYTEVYHEFDDYSNAGLWIEETPQEEPPSGPKF